MTVSLAQLRQQMQRIECPQVGQRSCLPFGVEALDAHLPGGGLALGALHEVAGGGDLSTAHGAAATLFTAGILARMDGPVLWCVSAPDLFAPGLAQAGLTPDRLLYAEAGDDKTTLILAEEGLRHSGLAAVVAELERLPMVASRRLQVAARKSGVTAIALRRWRTPQAAATEFGQPTSATTRWQVTALPSTPAPFLALLSTIGRARWRVELVRCRGADSNSWEVEACDAQGRLGELADMADGQAAAGLGSRRATTE